MKSKFAFDLWSQGIIEYFYTIGWFYKPKKITASITSHWTKQM